MSIHASYDSRIIVRDNTEIKIVFRSKFMLVEAEDRNNLILAHVNAADFPTPEGFHEVRIKRVTET